MSLHASLRGPPHPSPGCVSTQALVQELNFSAYLGLPVFMMPIHGPHNANLARMLLNHIHTGHHTSNVSPGIANAVGAPWNRPYLMPVALCLLISSGYVFPSCRQKT